MTDAMGQSYERREAREEAADPGRREERERVKADVAARLRDRGVDVDEGESSEDLVTALEAVERFERAVEAKGGDLMVDEAPDPRATQPDDEHFVLPRRRADESIPEYLARIDEATSAVNQHPPLAG
ncbi:MAG: hypothetical protein ACREON_10615 [Gemmatimonadaceae bacterium]